MKTTHTAEFYRGRDGDHRWRMRARNGRIVGDCGEGYRRMIDCKRAFYRLVSAMADGTVRMRDLK